MENKFKFVITSVQISFISGTLTSRVVYIRMPGESKEQCLIFNKYELAEAWINDQRENGDTSMYEIHKIYVL